MKLQKFSRRLGNSELLNTSLILSINPLGSDTVISYKYFEKVINIVLTGTVSEILSTLSTNRKYSIDLLVLHVISIDGLVKNQDMPINLSSVIRGVTRGSHSLLYCDASYFNRDTKSVSIEVSETLDQIVTDQLFTFEAGTGPTSLALSGVDLIDGDTLITHDMGTSLMGVFIQIDGIWQPWSFHYGQDESELTPSEQLISVYIPFSESKTVNLNLIF
jgi:hypothetical protein